MYIYKMEVKLCKLCNEVKDLETGYYKAGGSYQKYCKPCHNKKRYEYKMTPSKYVKKLKGFSKLPAETQEKIIYDIYVKIQYKEIAKKYGIKYQTLLCWKRKGLIPNYEPPTKEERLNSKTENEPAVL